MRHFTQAEANLQYQQLRRLRRLLAEARRALLRGAPEGGYSEQLAKRIEKALKQ